MSETVTLRKVEPVRPGYEPDFKIKVTVGKVGSAILAATCGYLIYRSVKFLGDNL